MNSSKWFLSTFKKQNNALLNLLSCIGTILIIFSIRAIDAPYQFQRIQDNLIIHEKSPLFQESPLGFVFAMRYYFLQTSEPIV